MTTPYDVISYLLPFVASAGAYSAQIQRTVSVHEAKAGETPFHHALSDADLTIQSYLEVALLAKYPALHFFSEEQEQSLNAKYFLRTDSLEVLLDPIDGTRPYIDGRAQYQIIVTLHDEEEIVGAICYMPRKDLCYIASKGNGAYALSHYEVATRAPGKRILLTQNEGPVLLFNAPALRDHLAVCFEAKDLAETYTTAPGVYDSTDLIAGKASSIVHNSCQAIDGGALAFIACEAGGIMTNFTGAPPGSFREDPKRTLRSIVVSATREIHEQVLDCLAKRATA